MPGASGMRATRIASLVFVSLLLALAVGTWRNLGRTAAPAGVRPEVGFAAPPLAVADGRGGSRPLTDLRGRPVRLEDHRGRVVFVNFWASWCAPCRREMPEIQRIYEKYGDRVAVLAVNATDRDSEEAARRFVESLGLTFDVPLDPTGQVTDAYRVRLFPTSFFIDAEGVVRARVEGEMSFARMEAAIREAGLPRR